MMKRLMMLLILSSAAFGQGVSFQAPAIESQVPQPIAGLTGSVCLATSTGTPCTPTVTVYSDPDLQPAHAISTLTTNGDGLFPTFFISPGQYQWCASDTLGRISAYCTKFTAPAVNGSTLTLSGNVPTVPALGATGGALNVQKTTGGTAIYNARFLDSFGNTNGQIIGVDVEQLINPSGNVNYLTFGQVTEVAIPTSNAVNFTGGDQTATYGSVSDFGSGTLNSISGITGEGFNAGPATATLVKGATATANCGGVVVNGIPGQTQTPTNNGICTNIRAFDGVANNKSSGTVTNGAAFYAEAPSNTGGGTFTNAYGLFVADMTAATNNFAIKTGLGKVSFGDTVAVGLWNSVRVVDGIRFTTINAAENDCSTANCIVIIPSVFACGSGQSLAAKDNITVWDFRQCSSPQSTSGHLFYSVKDTNNGAVRDKMMLVDSFTPTNDMSAASSSASFYTHAFAEGNLATFATLEAINGTITVDTGATNSPAAVVGIEGEASVSGTVANTLTDVRGGTFNVGLTGAGSITNATALVAQAVTNTGSGTVSNAVGFKCENQTVGTVSNLCLWAQGVSAFDKPVSFGSFSGGIVPQAGAFLFVRPQAGQMTGTSQIGAQIVPICSSQATAACEGIRARFDTDAAAFTTTAGSAIHITEGTKGAGSSITTEVGLLIEPLSNGGTNLAIQVANQIKNTLATGTSPFVITSTTPVANLTTVPTAYDHTGAQITAYHLVEDSCVLGTSCGVTLAGSSVYTSSTSYTCTCQDETAIAACKVAQTAGNAFTVTGTGTDTIRYHCGGN